MPANSKQNGTILCIEERWTCTVTTSTRCEKRKSETKAATRRMIPLMDLTRIPATLMTSHSTWGVCANNSASCLKSTVVPAKGGGIGPTNRIRIFCEGCFSFLILEFFSSKILSISSSETLRHHASKELYHCIYSLFHPEIICPMPAFLQGLSSLLRGTLKRSKRR